MLSKNKKQKKEQWDTFFVDVDGVVVFFFNLSDMFGEVTREESIMKFQM